MLTLVAGVAMLGAMIIAVAPGDSAGSPPQEPAKERRPNIVFILTDDLSKDLVPHLSTVRAMKRNGTTFSNHFAADALCCPSRANILTGCFPHNTGVRVNEGNRKIPGGWKAFVKKGNQKRTYAIPLQRAGYRTGFMGKYLNGYRIGKHAVPRGWDEWHTSSNGYNNIAGSYKITKVRNAEERKHPADTISEPKVYLNDLFGNRGKAFVNRAGKQPFFLQINSFAPHQRVDSHRKPPKNAMMFPPAFRDRAGNGSGGDCGTMPNGKKRPCGTLHVKRGAADLDYKKLDRWYRNRVQMMQSLNDSIKELKAHLRKKGELDNTIFVFSSDNGFHLGQHGLSKGKGTAYDHDTNVPLIVEGPGVKRGQVVREFTQTVDFYPTFQQLAGLDPQPSNGISLVRLLRGQHPQHWRDGALVEHKPQQKSKRGKHQASIGTSGDPDLDGGITAAERDGFNPAFTAYNALRTRRWLYVDYTGSKRGSELYDLSKDKAQNTNVRARHPKKAKRLHRWLTTYTHCGTKGRPTCWKAGHARFQDGG